MSRQRAQFIRTLGFATLAVLGLTRCGEGGLNFNERTAGSGEDGVSVGFGEIAIDPTGSYLLSRSDDAFIYGDLTRGEAHLLDLDLPDRIAFGHTERTIFATRTLEDSHGVVYRHDLTTGKTLWTRNVEMSLWWDDRGFGTRPWLDVLSNDARVLLTYVDRVELLDAQTGERLFSTPVGADIVDIDVTPDESRLVVTRQHEFRGENAFTPIEVYDLATFARTAFEVPNCADELTLTRDGKRAFLAPTTCQRDPVSVIDLEKSAFVRNLPGFGPVALSPKGDLAVAFLDLDNLDSALFDGQAVPSRGDERYHLMLIDTATLAFETLPLGDTLPRYAVSPDGRMLLIDASSLFDDGRIRVLDVATKTLEPVKGPEVRLENYVVTRDSQSLYLLDRGLYEVSLTERAVDAKLLDFTPDSLNITPDDSTLVLREDDDTLWLYDTRKDQLARRVRLVR